MEAKYDYTKRQSRWELPHKGAAIGDNILIQPRDLDIFEILFKYGYASAAFLREATSPETSNEKFSVRLKRLYWHRYLTRPEQQKNNHNANYSHLVYQLSPASGVQALLENGRVTTDDVWRRRTFMRAKYQEFWHDLNLGNTIASLELGLPLGVKFITPFDILARAPRATQKSEHPFGFETKKGGKKHYTTPDYVFGIEYPGEKRRFFLHEHDQVTESVERTRSTGSAFIDKLHAYDELLSKDRIGAQLNFASPIFITIATLSERHRQSIMSHVKDLKNRKQFLSFTLPLASETKVPKPWIALASMALPREGAAPLTFGQL